MALVRTIKGEVEEGQLARTVGFEDRPTQYAVWIEWRLEGELVRRDAFLLPKDTRPTVETIHGPMDASLLQRTIELRDIPSDISVGVCWRLNDELVRRDAHVIAKDPSVVATAIAATIG